MDVVEHVVHVPRRPPALRKLGNVLIPHAYRIVQIRNAAQMGVAMCVVSALQMLSVLRITCAKVVQQI